MSTKTTFKRIALVAVAALGLGVVTSVAPASAAQAAAATFTTASTTATTTQASGRVGVAANVVTNFNFAADSGATDTITLTSAFSAKPAGSTATITPVASAVVTGGGTAGPTINTNTVSGSTATILLSALGTAADASDAVELSSTFTPDVAGTYTVLTWHDANLNGALDADEAYATKSFSIAADAPTVAMTVYGSTTVISPATTDDDLGALVKV